MSNDERRILDTLPAIHSSLQVKDVLDKHLPPEVVLEFSGMLRKLMGDRYALRDAAEKLIEGLKRTSTSHWANCEEFGNDGCEVTPMKTLYWEGGSSDFCDVCARDILEGPTTSRPLRAVDLPHAPALRLLRVLIGDQ